MAHQKSRSPKVAVEIVEDDISRVFREIQQQAGESEAGDGLTTTEIGERLGLKEKACRDRVKLAVRQGRMELCPALKQVMTMNGRFTSVPAYRLVQKSASDGETPSPRSGAAKKRKTSRR